MSKGVALLEMNQSTRKIDPQVRLRTGLKAFSALHRPSKIFLSSVLHRRFMTRMLLADGRHPGHEKFSRSALDSGVVKL